MYSNSMVGMAVHLGKKRIIGVCDVLWPSSILEKGPVAQLGRASGF